MRVCVRARARVRVGVCARARVRVCSSCACVCGHIQYLSLDSHWQVVSTNEFQALSSPSRAPLLVGLIAINKVYERVDSKPWPGSAGKHSIAQVVGNFLLHQQLPPPLVCINPNRHTL